jgi:hypothetical protein
MRRPSTPTPKPQESPTDSGEALLRHRVTRSPANTEYGVDPWATHGEETDADADSEAPTPWPESWYEGGSELGLQQFAAQVMVNCQSYREDTGDTNAESGTAQCPNDNDAGHHRREDTGGTTTAGVSSTSSQTSSYAEAQPLAGHGTKRPRNSDDGGNEEDRPPKRRDANSPPDSDANRRKSYACPYQKRNPQQSPFCGMPHGPKRGFGWSTVSRVK